jgi:hypothetical protein
MCTSIVEIAPAEGMAKCGDEWFRLSHTVVAYDHARHAPLGDVITLDFINTALEPGARAGIELTLETARELRSSSKRRKCEAESVPNYRQRSAAHGWSAALDGSGAIDLQLSGLLPILERCSIPSRSGNMHT